VNSEQLPNSNDSAEDYERLKSSLVSLISHELRTPLTYVSASLEMIEIALEVPEMQAEVKRFLNIIGEGVKQLHHTIDELLLFSNLEKESPDKLKIQIRENIDVQELVCEVVNVLKPTFQAKKQVLEISIQEHLPPLITDSGKLFEVMVQLLSNAIKFTPQGGHIRIMVIGSEQMLTFIVSDNGPGIPASLREKIFNPFFQQEDHLIREHGGLGLGLTLVQRLCNILGGQLRLDVEEGKYTGSTFILEIPRINPVVQKNQEMQQMLADLKNLTRSNAEKEEQLMGMKKQLLEYTSALNLASQSNLQQKQEMEKMYVEMIQGLAFALETRDAYTRGRSHRIAGYAELIATELNLPQKERDTLLKACLLCDIGYIGIPDTVLQKDQLQGLSEADIEQIKTHTRMGAQMLNHIQAFEEIVPLVRSHHENWDGSGYPEGLKGEAIPKLARIIHLADAFDAMLSDRAYRQRYQPEYVVDEIKKHSGTQFDPDLAKLLNRLWQTGKLQPVISALVPNLSVKGDSQ